MQQTKFSMGEAAKVTGISKSTISRDRKSGKISANKKDDGSFEFDASELMRVYDWNGKDHSATVDETPQRNDPQHPETPDETGGLQAEVQRLRELLALMNTERDRERQQLSDQIEDLRTRLDQEGEERRALTLRLIAPPSSHNDNPAVTTQAPATASAGQARRGLFGLFRR